MNVFRSHQILKSCLPVRYLTLFLGIFLLLEVLHFNTLNCIIILFLFRIQIRTGINLRFLFSPKKIEFIRIRANLL